MVRITWKRAAQIVAVALLTACGMDASAPTSPLQPADADRSLLGFLTHVRPLNRLVALDHDIEVSRTIGSGGGTIAIPETGFRLTVPAGAVTSNTRFVVRALEGTAVAYEFEPHGTVFRRSLVATQSLDGTIPRLGLLQAAYFRDRALINPSGLTAVVSELLGGVTNLLNHSFTWRIDHFSGYIVAW
ncbi:MAG: hypothetical protein ABI910_21225 [Gemmatimonadota bacterium]